MMKIDLNANANVWIAKKKKLSFLMQGVLFFFKSKFWLTKLFKEKNLSLIELSNSMDEKME